MCLLEIGDWFYLIERRRRIAAVEQGMALGTLALGSKDDVRNLLRDFDLEDLDDTVADKKASEKEWKASISKALSLFPKVKVT
jgi:hypothetical protein